MQHTYRKLVRAGSFVAGLSLLAAVTVSGGGSSVIAQEMDGPHPAHIHAGTCEELGEVVVPLSDVSGSYLMDGTPMAMGDMVGPETAIPVEASVTVVPLPLADIVAGGHSINIHESVENIGNYIACGAIGGTMMSESDLAIGLGTLNDSYHSGVAWLHDNGDGTTTVNVFLTVIDDDDDKAMEDAAAVAIVEGPHPAHIHAGTCETLGDVVVPLSDVSGDFLINGTPMAMGDMVGQPSAIGVESSVTSVALPLADIVAGGHAINVHESVENIGNYIACGAIGGKMMGASDLPIGLGELNGSHHSGIAWLKDNGDGTTTVNVFLTVGHDDDMMEGEMDEMGTPAADAGASDAAASAAGVAVDISGFAFQPQNIEVAVGDSVTWTNLDSVPHTATMKPFGSGFQSGTIAAGGTYSTTMESAGTFEYSCEFHDNMQGTIIVS